MALHQVRRSIKDGRRYIVALLAMALALALSLAPTGMAFAATPFATITSSPYTIYAGNDLSCQLSISGDAVFSFFEPSTIPADCGTFLVVNGQLYAPNFNAHPTATGGLGTYTPFTPVSQSAVTGAGTVGNPFSVTTVVDAGSTGLRLSQKVTYVAGNLFYTTDVTITNSSNTSQSTILYTGGDCFLAESDFGFGEHNVPTGAILCTTDPTAPPVRIVGFQPITSGSNYLEAFFNDLWLAIGSHAPFNNTCRCTDHIDNGAGLSWNVTVPAGGSATVSFFTISGLGASVVPTLTPTATPSPTPTATPSPTAGSNQPTPTPGGIIPPPNATPELSSIALFGSGALGLVGFAALRLRRRRRD